MLTQQRDNPRLLSGVEDVGVVGAEGVYRCSCGFMLLSPPGCGSLAAIASDNLSRLAGVRGGLRCRVGSGAPGRRS
jgi:hypothetical protein